MLPIFIFISSFLLSISLPEAHFFPTFLSQKQRFSWRSINCRVRQNTVAWKW